jgi:putative polyhydroxyalkanoate system protein
MPEIRIQRKHKLGLDRARIIARKWCEDLERKYDMECLVTLGEDADTVEFKRVGASGTMLVGGDRLEVTAQLGFLLGAFAKTIESEIERRLDDLLAENKSLRTAAKKPAVKASK